MMPPITAKNRVQSGVTRIRPSCAQLLAVKLRQNEAHAWRALFFASVFGAVILALGFILPSFQGQGHLLSFDVQQSPLLISKAQDTEQEAPRESLPLMPVHELPMAREVVIPIEPQILQTKFDFAPMEFPEHDNEPLACVFADLEFNLPEVTPDQPARPVQAQQSKAAKLSKPQSAKTNAAQTKQTAATAGGDMVQVSYKKSPKPPYPTSMRATKSSGNVSVRITINAMGEPTQVTVTKSSGYRELDDTACSWIMRNWSFNPAKRNGQNISSVVTTSINFVYSS